MPSSLRTHVIEAHPNMFNLCNCGSLDVRKLASSVSFFLSGKSGKEKAHKHKQFFDCLGGGGSPDRVARGLPSRWPGVTGLCVVCGNQGT